MSVLITGASGFLGKYLVAGMDSPPITLGRGINNDIVCDLAVEIPKIPTVEVVIHNAGLAHRIPKNPDEERKFYQTNLFGTQNLLSGLKESGVIPKVIIYISTVAVYGLDKGEGITENYLPKPESPYAKSKYEAELLLRNWVERYPTNLVILRLPLVAGGIGTPGNLGAMIKAIKSGYYFRIGTGLNKKSMVLAQDVANLIPRLKEFSGIYNLTDDCNPSVKELEEYLGTHFDRKIRTINSSILRVLCFIGDNIPGFPINSYRLGKLSETLTFDDSKAKIEIGWKPRPVIGNLDLEPIRK